MSSSISITAMSLPTTIRDDSASWIWFAARRSRPIRGSARARRRAFGPEFDAARLAKLLRGVAGAAEGALCSTKSASPASATSTSVRRFFAPASILRDPRAFSPTLAAVRPAPPSHWRKAIHEVLEQAIEAGGSTLRDHRQADGDLGYFQHAFSVYDREGAACPRPRCGGTIARMSQSGRSTFYCPVCQK